ncbi:Fe-S cluster assembly protein SufD [Nevskia sp.]|uniref:Fe-S cluster assembly protein SufD n=1 Tax=Nevskia sp. TaxID=1929292 RepID=UPI0025D41252|nr:Fe-S cluster assembly protein SufD [Nevskia sp.]HET7797935.1 Fe-S cluster assembly protein SufD [Nevskia sp.]
MPLSSYSTQFERHANALTAAERAPRSVQFARFLDSGFPSRDEEHWHYTDLTALSDRSFEPEGQTAEALPQPLLDDADALVYLNGRLLSERGAADWHSDAAELPPPSRGVDALNAAFATGGLRLRLSQGERLTRPLQVVLISRSDAQPTMSHQRHVIELGDQAEATVLLDFVGDGGERLATHFFELRLGRGARLNLYRIQNEAAGGTLVARIDAKLSRDAKLNAVTVDLGAGLARHDLDINLAEAGAEADVAGLYAAQAGAHIDNLVRVVHSAAHCRSRMNVRGLVDERTKAIFNGKVLVQPGAQKTDSEQRIANLLLSRKAEVNAKPDLEIYADDVKCAHGATVGQLDQVALSYLRSRGIPKDVARGLLLRAFAIEILDRFDWPALRARVEANLHLPSELTTDFEP